MKNFKLNKENYTKIFEIVDNAVATMDDVILTVNIILNTSYTSEIASIHKSFNKSRFDIATAGNIMRKLMCIYSDIDENILNRATRYIPTDIRNMVSRIRYNIHQSMVSVYYIIESDVLNTLNELITKLENDDCCDIAQDIIKKYQILSNDNTMVYKYMSTLLDFDINTDDSGCRLDDIKNAISKIKLDVENMVNCVCYAHEHIEEISPIMIINNSSYNIEFSIVTDDGSNKVISIPQNIIYDLIRNIRISERKPKKYDE